MGSVVDLIEVLVPALSALSLTYGIYVIVVNIIRGFRLDRWLKWNCGVLGRIVALLVETDNTNDGKGSSKK